MIMHRYYTNKDCLYRDVWHSDTKVVQPPAWLPAFVYPVPPTAVRAHAN